MRLERIGLIGDVHAEDARLEAALQFLSSRNASVVLCVGDIADGRGDLARCVALLRENSVLCVRGNHDDWFLNSQARDLENAQPFDALDSDARAWLGTLPPTREFETASGRLLLCHGVGFNAMCNLRPHDEGYALESNDDLQRLLREDRFDWMLNGHTHQRMVRRFGRLTNINAGKIGARDDGTASGIWIVDFRVRLAYFHRFESDSELDEVGEEIAL